MEFWWCVSLLCSHGQDMLWTCKHNSILMGVVQKEFFARGWTLWLPAGEVLFCDGQDFIWVHAPGSFRQCTLGFTKQTFVWVACLFNKQWPVVYVVHYQMLLCHSFTFKLLLFDLFKLKLLVLSETGGWREGEQGRKVVKPRLTVT